MTQKSNEVIRLGQTLDLHEAHLWRQVLEEEGIQCRVVGELFENYGVGPVSPVEVWVREGDVELARATLARCQYDESAAQRGVSESARILRDLVSIPSVNPMGRPLSGPEYLEHRVTDYLERFFRELGVPYERQPVEAQRENIVARYEGTAGAPALMFEAHQDTVPTDGMTIEPFGAKIENGRLYGRGACDIKGGMAAMLAAFARVVREKPPGAASLVMACVVDEEFMFSGITELARRKPRVDMAIVAEPTKLEIVNAHKGVVRWHLHTSGRACHSSNPDLGVNAIYRMARLLAGIEQYAAQLKRSPADSVLGPPTMSVGLINGGVSVNTVPEHCRIEIDRRLVVNEDPMRAWEDLQTFLRSSPEVDFEFQADRPWMCKPALSPKGSEAVSARLGAAIDKVIGVHRVVSVPYGTDAPELADAGISTVVFGPGDIAQAHTADEWVALDEIEKASEILYRFATGTPR